jgi:hypothetical protein
LCKKENFEKFRLFGALPVFISTSIFEIGFFSHWFMHKKSNVSAFLAFLIMHPRLAFSRVNFPNFSIFPAPKVDGTPAKPRKSQHGA